MKWEGLNQFLAFADLKNLSSAQRVAYLAYWYSSQIVMAGHHDYFSTPPKSEYSEVASALRTIDATEQASILIAALDAIHVASARAPGNFSNRFAAGVEFADFTQFDDAFDRCTRSIPDCLMDYVQQNETEFIEWKP
jgi:hypothetical protein